MTTRPTVVVVVADGAGVGAAPDAAAFATSQADTVGHAVAATGLSVPNLSAMGLGHVCAPVPASRTPLGVAGRVFLTSAGNDTPTGHWELFGAPSPAAPVTFPDGFPTELVAALADVWGTAEPLGNVVMGGLEVLDRFGAESLESGTPILYTSADSVLQVAAHIDVTPPEQLWEFCEQARAVCGDRWPVGRIIARPFSGSPGAFVRESSARRDFALAPPSSTVLDVAVAAGVDVVSVAKIGDVFAHRSTGTETHPPDLVSSLSDAASAASRLSAADGGLVVANLAEFDYAGHARDPHRFASALEVLDRWCGEFLAASGPDVVLVVTADHGNDPTLRVRDDGVATVDHTREFVPVLAARGGGALGPGVVAADAPAFTFSSTLRRWLGLDPAAFAVAASSSAVSDRWFADLGADCNHEHR